MTQSTRVSILLAIGVSFFTFSAEGGVLSRLERGESLTICSIGTSVTGNYYDPAAKVSRQSAWFPMMGKWLNSLYPGKVTVFNEGIGGAASEFTATYTLATSGAGSGLDVQLAKALAHNPDVLFIEFAANDAYLPYSISLQMSRDNLQEMIDRTNAWAKERGRKVDIVVQTMSNMSEKHLVPRPDLPKYFQVYRDVAAANGLLLIDHYPNWLKLYESEVDHATWNRYVPDGAHPHEEGAERVILPEIQRALKAQAAEGK